MTADYGFPLKLNPEIAMDKQPTLMFALPSDVVLEVIAYLNKRDCLTCMAVCHEWYDKIPQYTQSIWKELRLNTKYMSGDHQRLGRCLGSHVKHVVISPAKKECVEQEQLHFIMRKLIDWKCIEIESFELQYGVTAKDQATFVDLLKRLAPRLTRLKLPSHMSDIQILHLLYAFPEVTHFTCCYSDLCYISPGVSATSSTPDDYMTKLTYLSLGMCRITKKEKEFLLKRSPNLRCYIDLDQNNSFYGVNLYSLFQWCPDLNLVAADRSAGSELESFSSTYLNNDVPGLRYFSIAEKDPEFDQVSRVLVQNQDTLEYLSITNTLPGHDWTQLSDMVQLPSLRTLICERNDFSADSFIAMLNRAPLLDKIKVNLHSSFTLGLTVVRSLGTLHHLHNLTINNIVLDSDLSLLALLEHTPVLEKLQISDMTLPLKTPVHFKPPQYLKHLELRSITWTYSDGNDKEGATARFFEGLTASSRLENLQLQNTTVAGFKPLQTIAKISTLTYLEVQLDLHLQEQKLLEFIKMLQSTAIESFKLYCVCYLSCAVLEALADFPHLTKFCLERGPSLDYYYARINKEGLVKLLCKSPKLTAVMLNQHFTVEDGEELLRISQLVALMKEKAPYFEISPIPTPGFTTIASAFYTARQSILSKVAITRVDKAQ